MFPISHIGLRRKLGPFRTLPLYAPQLNELFALLSGVKPLIFETVPPKYLDEMRKVCAGLRLHIQPFEDKELQAGRTFVLLGKDKALLRRAVRHYSNQQKEYMEWGEALGYPACCVTALHQWAETKMSYKVQPDIVEFVMSHTPRRGWLPFHTNNVFNYFSRPGKGSAGYDKADRDRSHFVSQKNLLLAFPLLPIITWHPCSYFCAESLKKAKVIFEFMSHHVPEFSEVRRLVLSKPVFFVDKYRFAVLNDISRRPAGSGVEIEYAGLFRLHSLIDASWLALLKENSVIAQCGRSVRLGGRVLESGASSGRDRCCCRLPIGSPRGACRAGGPRSDLPYLLTASSGGI